MAHHPRIQQLGTALNKKARIQMKCPTCGGVGWQPVEEPIALPRAGGTGEGIEVLAQGCEGCGFLAFYAAQTLLK